MAFEEGYVSVVKLAEALGLSTKKLRSITIHASCTQALTVTAEYLAGTEQVDALARVLGNSDTPAVVNEAVAPISTKRF